MANSTQLQSKLVEILGSKNVYYQPPESIRMQYPAIRFSKKPPDLKHANDSKYSKMSCYEIIVIDILPDNESIDKILELPYSSWDRHYTADNLNHDVLTLYY